MASVVIDYITYTQFDSTTAYVSRAETQQITSALTILSSVSIDGSDYIVTSIGDYAFQTSTVLASLTIPDSVTSIGNSAFDFCTSLTSVIVGSSVSSINNNAFSTNRALTSIVFNNQNNLGTITGTDIFGNTGAITSVTFYNTANEAALVPGAVNLKNEITLNNNGVTYYYIPGSPPIPPTVIDGVVYTRAGVEAIAYVSGSNNVDLIPATIIQSIVYIDGSCSVTSIATGAFNNRPALTSVIIPDSVTTVGTAVFANCTALQSATLGTGLTFIGPNMFDICSALTSVTILGTITSIGFAAFASSGQLPSFTIPDSVTSMGNQAFWQCYALTSVTIGSSLAVIPFGTFGNCNDLSSVTISDQRNLSDVQGDEIFLNDRGITTVTFYNTANADALVPGAIALQTQIETFSPGVNYVYISGPPPIVIDGIVYTKLGANAFVSGFTANILPASTIQSSVSSSGTVYPVNYINVNAFQDCTTLTSITIPSSVTAMGDRAFLRCSALSSVNIIGTSINSIGTSAFDGCSVLSSFTIPSLVTNISDSMFARTAITGITIPSQVNRLGFRVFQDCSAMISVTFNGNLIPALNDDVFLRCSSLSTITIPSSVTSILSGAFNGCSSLTAITIPSLVTSIGVRAFRGCSALSSITIPSLVTTIGSDAFNGCSGITSVNIGNNVTSLGTAAFGNCSSLSSFNIPNQLTFVEAQLLEYCTSLTSITIPESVTSIRDYAFRYTGLTSIVIPNTVRTLGEFVFQGCASLTSITIGTEVVSIGAFAFSDCFGVTFINIPNSVTSIGNGAFTSCVSMTSITIGTSFTRFNGGAFIGCTSLASLTFSDPTKLGPSQGSINFNSTGRISRVVFNNITSAQLNEGGQLIQNQINQAPNPGVIYVFSPTLSNFEIPDKTFGDAPFQITPPTSNSTGAFSYTSSNLNVATIEGDIITIVGRGTSIITAIQEPTLNFGQGSIDTSFQVLKGPPTLSNFVIVSKTTVDPPFQITPPTSNSDGSFTYLSSNPAVATISGNIITIRGLGTSTITANQAATAEFEAGSIDTSFQVNLPPPTLSNFEIPQKFISDPSPFQITPPTSNSTGAFTYTSSNPAVATISGNMIYITGPGNSIITATQAATSNYASGSIISNFLVISPIYINSSSELLNFMNSTNPNEFYGVITASITIDYDLTSLAQKTLVTSNVNVKITRD